MALATRTPTTSVNPKPTMPQAASDNYKGLVYDNNRTPLVSLLAYIDGAPWTVDTYFKQELAVHNDVKLLDTTLAPPFQPYEAIKRLELLIDTDLQSSIDTTNQTSRVTGSAYIYPFFVPNVNDYFIASAGYEQPALFRVTSVDRRTFRTESVHYIEFKMEDFLDRRQNECADLNRKTVREYVFSRERLMEGLAPTLKTETYAALGNLKEEYSILGNYYLDTFFDRGTKTLILPGQPTSRIYDPFLISFIMSTFSLFDFDQLLNVKELNKSGDQYLDQPQFWQGMLKRSRRPVDLGNQHMRFVRTGQFDNNTWIKSLAFARMDWIVYPSNPNETANSGFDGNQPLTVSSPGIKATTNSKGKVLTYQEKLYPLANTPILSYPMVFDDPGYVLSTNFYENNDKLTLLELMVRDYLASKTLNLEHIKHMLSLYPNMERMEQFYFGPILMTLVRYYQQRAY